MLGSESNRPGHSSRSLTVTGISFFFLSIPSGWLLIRRVFKSCVVYFVVFCFMLLPNPSMKGTILQLLCTTFLIFVGKHTFFFPISGVFNRFLLPFVTGVQHHSHSISFNCHDKAYVSVNCKAFTQETCHCFRAVQKTDQTDCPGPTDLLWSRE